MAKDRPYSHFVPAVPQNTHYEDNLHYVLIETLDQLKESFKKGKGYVVAWDTETTGLNPEHSDIVGFSYTIDGLTGYYCPVKHVDLALGKPALDLFYEFLKLSKFSLLYNARFDIRIMEYSGYDMSFLYPEQDNGSYIPKFFDVMNQTWLADTNIPLPSLKASTLHFLGYQPPKFLETLGSEQNFQYVPAKQAYRYACFAKDTLIQTKHGLKKIEELKPNKDLIKTSIGYNKLLNVLPQGTQQVIKITPPYGLPFTCTPDHKFSFYIKESENDKGRFVWIEAKDLDKIPLYFCYHGGESLNDVEEVYLPDNRFLNEKCKIEYLDNKEEVYDLSIENEHNFFLQCGLIAHNCLDAINTYNLFKITYKFVQEAPFISQLDNACTYIIGQLEKQPLNMNTDYLISLRDNVYTHVQELEKEIYSLAGHPFNINSNRELTQVFMEQGIDTGEKTKAGDMKTGKELLNLYLRNHPECTILEKIIEYKEQFKFYNSYLKTLVDIAKQQKEVPPRFSYKLQSVPCLTRNNLVLVKDKGLISIASVIEQDYIWTQYGYKRVLWNNSHKSDNLYHVTFNNSFYIEGTHQHPVLVNKGTPTDIQLEWATLESLQIGEHVIINHHTPNLEKTEEGTFTHFIEYLGFLSAPLLLKDTAFIPEYKGTLEDLKKNTGEAFRLLTQSIMNDTDSVMRLVSRAKPGDWISFLKGLLYAVFETRIAQNWNSDFEDTRIFKIYSDNTGLLLFIMSILSYLGIQSIQKYNGLNFYLEFSSSQSLVLMKQLVISETKSKYLTELFNPILDYYIEYEDAIVLDKQKIPGEDTVYDIEVEDVHEYVANGIVTHNTGRLACITGDTLIPTTLGKIPIEELSLYEDGNEVYIDAHSTALFHTLYMGEKQCVELHLDNGKKIKATLDHRFMNTHTDWVYVNDLKVGDSLICVNDNSNDLSTTKVTNIIPIKEPQPVWTLTVNHQNHQYLSNTLISHNCGKDGKNTYFAPVNLQCLEENTLVKTDRGNIPIKNVTKEDLVWTGTRFVPCVPLGHKRKHCYKIKTLWGEIEASLEHRFLTLNHKTWELEWNTLGECILHHYPIVRDPQDLGISFDELYDHKDYQTKRNRKRELSLEEYKEYLDLYKDCKFDIITESPEEFWNTKMDVPHLIKTVYDLYVPEYNQFTANGFIVHNSLPKPKSIKCYGRKATQEEKDQHLDVLGWMFSPDHPEWSPGKIVEGMKQKYNVRSAFLPQNPENGDYVISIDMCLEAGSPVQSKRGYLGISELKVGDEILAPQGWVKVIRVMQTGIKKLIKVYPDNGGQAIYCTEDHHFQVNGEKIEAKDIQNPLPSSSFYSYNKDSDKKYNNPFVGDSTPTSAYLYGFLLVGGCIKRKIKEDDPDVIEVSHKDYYILQRIREIIGESVKLYTHNQRHYLEIEDSYIYKRLIELSSPSIDVSWLGDNFRHFIRGLIDARGFVLGYNSKKGKSSYIRVDLTGSEDHIKQIWKMDPTRWKFIPNLNSATLTLTGDVEDKKFIYNYLYEGATVWQQQKRDIIEKWYTENFGDIILPVWNITVDTPEHEYYVNGVLTHNCAEELKIVTNLFKEDSWARVINSGGDLHHANSDAIFGPENYTKETRKRSKGAAFGILYGQEYQGFQRKFPDMTIDEAKEFMAKFKSTIPHIIHGQDRMVREAQRTGTCYSGFGRPRRVKHYLTSSDYKDVAFGKRTVKNNPIQGTAADVLKLEFIRLWQNIFKKYPEIRFVCTIHDEINFSVPRHLADEVIPILVKCMTVKMSGWLVELSCSLSAGPSLGSQYAMKYNFETKEFEPDWEEYVPKEEHQEQKEDNHIEFPDEQKEDPFGERVDEEEDNNENTSDSKQESIDAIDSKMFEF